MPSGDGPVVEAQDFLDDWDKFFGHEGRATISTKRSALEFINTQIDLKRLAEVSCSSGQIHGSRRQVDALDGEIIFCGEGFYLGNISRIRSMHCRKLFTD